MTKKWLLTTLLVMACGVSDARAEFRQIDLTIFGMD